MRFERELCYLWKAVNDLDGPDGPLHSACAPVLECRVFLYGYGSSKKHHAYAGGLVVHTAEVVRVALAMADASGADKSVLTVAGVWHDFGKTMDYDLNGQKDSWHYEMIGHLPVSHLEFAMKSGLHGTAIGGMVEHCILSHHGRLEWRSPVEPKTKEAMILHYADMISSNYGAGKERL